jgi:MFS family permease
MTGGLSLVRAPSASQRTTVLVTVLVTVTLVASIISSLGAPLIPSVASTLHVSLDSAQWSLTVALLAGAVAAPILGRLGDGPFRRQAILGALGVVFVGSLIAAVSQSLAPLLLGRAMEGVGLGLAAPAMAAARDHLGLEQGRSVIGLLSVTAATGAGAGYPISGLIVQELNLHAAFYFGAIMSAAALIAAALVIPSSRDTSRVPLDVKGAAVLVVGLVALLLAIGQGAIWGWGSTATIGLFVLAVLVLSPWARDQLRREAPLVALGELRHRAVLTANLAALILGVAMYMFLTLVTELAQLPSVDGGFGTSVPVAGLCLVPFAVASLAVSRTTRALLRRLGTRTVLVGGSFTIAAAGVFLAVEHEALWEAFLTMALVGVGFGLTFAAIPGLIAQSVPDHETGSAMGLYQVIRYVGFSIGSALTASILAGHIAPGASSPDAQGYAVGLAVAGAICALSAVVSAVLARGRPEPARSGATDAARQRLILEEAELASAGLAGFEIEDATARVRGPAANGRIPPNARPPRKGAR